VVPVVDCCLLVVVVYKLLLVPQWPLSSPPEVRACPA
jgi:hypothetical protein